MLPEEQELITAALSYVDATRNGRLQDVRFALDDLKAAVDEYLTEVYDPTPE